MANADRYDTEFLKMAYVESRTEGNAAKHLEPRMRKDSPKPFLSSDEMLNTLEKIFDDPNRKLTALTQFRSLRQGGKDFNSFWAEFQRLAYDIDATDAYLMSE